MKRIVCCAAMPLEVKPLCRLLKIPLPNKRNKIQRYHSPEHGEVICAVSGMGYARMERLLSDFPMDKVDCWISLGFSGALQAGLSAGNVIRSSNVIIENGESLQPLSPRIFGNIEQNGKLLFIDTMITAAKMKKDFCERFQANAIDMESAAIARHALRRQEPFLGIRVICDELEESLPEEFPQLFDRDGYPSSFAAMKVLFRKPHIFPDLLRMGRRSVYLSQILADEVLQLIRS